MGRVRKMLKFQRDVHYSRGKKKLAVNVYVLEIRGRGDEIKVKKGYMATEGIGWSNVLSERNKIEEKVKKREATNCIFDSFLSKGLKFFFQHSKWIQRKIHCEKYHV